MIEQEWAGVLTYPLAGRVNKPRHHGVTMVLDKGMGLGQIRDLFEIAGAHMDFLKLGFGTSALYAPGVLPRKISLAAGHGITVYPGGTFLEVAVLQGRADQFFARARVLGFGAVEISNGVVPVVGPVRRDLIRRAAAMGFLVLTEVGCKDARRQPTASELAAQALLDLEHGADYVICEARESGKGIGVYDAAGGLRAEEFEQLASRVPSRRLIWEAPLKPQQHDLISRLGVNVNLGNVEPQDVIALEALRTGLRADTLELGHDHDNIPAAAPAVPAH